MFSSRKALAPSLATLCLATLAPSTLVAEDTTTTPFDGVQYVHRHVSTPREIDMHLVLVDLTRPGVRVVTTGPNEDPGTETDVETTRQFAERTRSTIAINGGFYALTREAMKKGKTDMVSLAVSDGVVVSPWGTGQFDAVNIGADNVVTFIRQAQGDTTGSMTTPPVKLFNAISGNVRLIEGGKILAKGGDPTYPQTAVGHTADRRLILFVSDGRQKHSGGMTYEELASVLVEFGAVDAIAFDGGGSATMVMTDPATGKPQVLNRPSDGRERRVGNNLGIVLESRK